MNNSEREIIKKSVIAANNLVSVGMDMYREMNMPLTILIPGWERDKEEFTTDQAKAWADELIAAVIKNPCAYTEVSESLRGVSENEVILEDMVTVAINRLGIMGTTAEDLSTAMEIMERALS